MTYNEARDRLPEGAEWQCSFGNPGENGYLEYYRLDRARWNIGRDRFGEWTINRIGDAP